MSNTSYEFEGFATRESFNKSLQHFRAVSGIVADFEDGHNLADILTELLVDKELEQNQIPPIINALLVDKYHYHYESMNLTETVEDFSFHEEIRSWDGVDLVLAYAHPELGYTVINPKNSAHWESIHGLKKNELLIIFAGAFTETGKAKLYNKAIAAIRSLFEGKKPKSIDDLLKGNCAFQPYADESEPEEDEHVEESTSYRPASAADSGSEKNTIEETAPPKAVEKESGSARKRMTPLYSVPVTNELFHNGNVEAWKKIIASYTNKYPGLEVYVFYDGERIHDINSLFKWGKVKHGSSILFAVAGENIKDVAKLQRYLRQGASPKFEDFLRFPVNKILALF